MEEIDLVDLVDLEALNTNVNPYATPYQRRHRSPSRGRRKKDPFPVLRDFRQRIGRIGLEDLFYTDDKTNLKTINLATMQRMNIHALQMELVHEVGIIEQNYEVGRDQMPRINRIMTQYANAIRDWELIVKNSGQQDDPFILKGARALNVRLMNEAGLMRENHARLELCKDYDNPQLPFDSRGRLMSKRNLQAFWARFYMAMFGGIALIGPMILMVMKTDLTTALVTVSLSVFLFGLALAIFFTDVKPESVLASVAGYAAVLVVFVGTSNQTSLPSNG